jgi:hypothetical protein
MDPVMDRANQIVADQEQDSVFGLNTAKRLKALLASIYGNESSTRPAVSPMDLMASASGGPSPTQPTRAPVQSYPSRGQIDPSLLPNMDNAVRPAAQTGSLSGAPMDTLDYIKPHDYAPDYGDFTYGSNALVGQEPPKMPQGVGGARRATPAPAQRNPIWDDQRIMRSGEGGTESPLDFIRNAPLYKAREADLAAGNSPYASGGYAKGGDTGKVHVGPIPSSVAGRTDHLPMHVPSGSYVIPADIVSALGEGNTMSGFEIVDDMNADHHDDGRYASGGAVPIVAAGGEYVIPPHVVAGVGKGSLDTGHRVLDEFVKHVRAKTIKTLKKLPGPKKD